MSAIIPMLWVIPGSHHVEAPPPTPPPTHTLSSCISWFRCYSHYLPTAPASPARRSLWLKGVHIYEVLFTCSHRCSHWVQAGESQTNVSSRQCHPAINKLITNSRSVLFASFAVEKVLAFSASISRLSYLHTLWFITYLSVVRGKSNETWRC